MSETLKTLTERRSVRKYKKEQIKDEELKAVLSAGTFAATGMGMQSPRIVVIQDPEVIQKLTAINAGIMGKDGLDSFYGAPTVCVVFADSKRTTYVEDGSLVIGNMMNAASAIGLGSCWIHRAKEEFRTEYGKELMKKWGLSEDYVGIGHCILGYTDGKPAPAKPRKADYIIYDK